MSMGRISNVQCSTLGNNASIGHDAVCGKDDFIDPGHDSKGGGVLNQIALNTSFGKFFGGAVPVVYGWSFADNNLKLDMRMSFFQELNHGIGIATRQYQVIIIDVVFGMVAQRGSRTLNFFLQLLQLS